MAQLHSLSQKGVEKLQNNFRSSVLKKNSSSFVYFFQNVSLEKPPTKILIVLIQQLAEYFKNFSSHLFT